MEDPVYQELQIKRLSEITNVTNDSINRLYKQIINKKTISSDSTKSPTQTVQSPSKLSVENDLIKLCFSKDRHIRTLISDKFKP